MEELLQSFSNYGFPMVISAYLLIRFEGKIEHLATCIRDLAEVI